MDTAEVKQPQSTSTSEKSGSLPGPIALLQESWEIYKRRWKSYWGAAIYTFLMLMGTYLVLGLAFGATVLLGMTVLKENMPVLVLFGALLLLPALLLIIYVGTWAQLAMQHVIAFSDQNMRAWESFQKSRSKVWPFMWLGFLSSVIVGGAFLLFIIPGILFVIWFSLATYIFIVEGITGMPALLKSREYVRNYWWAVFGRHLAIGLISFIFSLFIAFLPGVIDNMAEGSGVVVNILLTIANIVIAPIFAFYPYLMYKYLKSIKGEVKIDESAKSKYLLVGILGIVTFVGAIGFAVWTLASAALQNPEALNLLMNMYGKGMKREYQNQYDVNQFNQQMQDRTQELQYEENIEYSLPTETPQSFQ
jgi:hypothetical protein